MSQAHAQLENGPGEESLGDIVASIDPADSVDELVEDGLPQPLEVKGDDPPADDDVPADDDDDPVEEVDIGGKKLRVKRSEMRAGYMKDADYRQKTAELADQRRTVEQHAQAIAQERQQAANQLDVYLQQFHRELIGTQPDQSLIESDPQEYLRQNALHQQRTAQFQAALQQRQALQGRMTADQQRQQQEWRQEQAQRLQQALPEWSDPKVRERDSGQIAGYLASIGYSNEEMAELTDHRALLVARDAAKFRELQAAKKKQQTPAIGRTLRPGAAADPAARGQSAQVSAANERLRRNPDSLDALVDYARARGGTHT